MPDYVDAPGKPVPAQELTLPRAKELTRLLATQVIPFARLVDTRRHQGPPLTETVVVDVEVERGQVRAHDIHRQERISITVQENDDHHPEVLALRKDFPKAPHQNLRSTEVPRSLCLYAQSWDDIKLHWTPTGYVGRLRYWLAETSKGTLHQEDQPLEPFFFSDGPIILPPDLFTDAIEGVPTRLSVTFPGGKDGRVLLAKKPVTEEGVDYLATVFCAKPQQHGIISHAPRNLEDLHHLVASAGLDLLGTLRSRIKDWREPTLLATRLILIIAFPKTRGAQDTIEATDLWAFFTASTIQKVGEQIGVWVMKDGQACPLIGGADQTKNGTGVGLDVLKPQFALDRVAAARLNNIGALEDRAMVAIGAGSLGSHVLTNLARAAFGHWSLIDEDYLLPHNLARHALTGFSVGYDKVISLAVFLNSLFPAHECFVKDVLTANVLRPGTQSPRVQQLLSDAAVILDLSASIPVARHLARDIASTARRVALFFNPQGTDLVLLCEDQARQYPIDALEMQYYRAIIAQPSLQRHLHQPQEGRLRYAQSCRDLTSRIPQDHVALLSAIGSNAFRQTIQQENAAIRLWHLDTTHLAVTPIHISPARIVRVQLGEWTLITDATLLAKIRRLRGRKLPNETGGVLLGSFDITRRIVYVIDTIPSPPDSKEWPTLYIRGHERLPAMIAHVEQATAGNIGYIGEWHSHPNGQRALPSKDDILVFAWLTELMDRDGRPALMLIIGDREYNFFLGNMTEGS